MFYREKKKDRLIIDLKVMKDKLLFEKLREAVESDRTLNDPSSA